MSRRYREADGLPPEPDYGSYDPYDLHAEIERERSMNMEAGRTPPEQAAGQQEEAAAAETAVFNRDNVGGIFTGAQEFQKQVPTKAVKIDGPFDVETSEGRLHCEGGYLALDARGYPYPIASEEFEQIYKPVAGVAEADHLEALRKQNPVHPESQQAIVLVRTVEADEDTRQQAFDQLVAAANPLGFIVADKRDRSE